MTPDGFTWQDGNVEVHQPPSREHREVLAEGRTPSYSELPSSALTSENGASRSHPDYGLPRDLRRFPGPSVTKVSPLFGPR